MGVRKPEKMSLQESASVLNCDLDIKAYLLLSWMIIWREPWSCVDEQQPTKCCPAAADLLYGGTVATNLWCYDAVRVVSGGFRVNSCAWSWTCEQDSQADQVGLLVNFQSSDARPGIS